VVVPYQFTLITGSGCIAADSLLVTVNPTPVINPINDIKYCNGEIDLDGISFSSSSPDPSFTWGIDKSVGFGLHGSENISGFIASNPGNDVLAATDTVRISVDNNLHCAGQPILFKIIVNPSAATPGFSWLDLNNGVLCNGAANINFNVNAPANANSYLWTTIPPYNPGVFIKDTNDANTVISFNDTGTYTIKVFATNQNGGCRDTVSKKIAVLNTSEIDTMKIILKQPGNILIYPDNSMDVGTGYQWGYDSLMKDTVIMDTLYYALGPAIPIPGQVYQFFTPNPNKFLDGDKLDTVKYKFWVLLQKGGCYTKVYYNGPYAARRIQVPSPEDNSVRLKVFPNPNNGMFNIDLKGNIYGSIQAKVYNAVGQLVCTKQFLKTLPETNEAMKKNNLPNGLYYLVLSSSDMKKVCTRFVIQH
jgi:hypothetical protein